MVLNVHHRAVGHKSCALGFGVSLVKNAVSIATLERVPRKPSEAVTRLRTIHRVLTKPQGSETNAPSIFHVIGTWLATFDISMVLGVVFGRVVPLLKHSPLNYYPYVETCSMALASRPPHNTLKGPARDEIQILRSQFAENFIFIYPGLSLFTSPRSSNLVARYSKPLSTAGTTVPSCSRDTLPSRWEGLPFPSECSLQKLREGLLSRHNRHESSQFATARKYCFSTRDSPCPCTQ